MTPTIRRASAVTISSLAAFGFACAPAASAATPNADAGASYLAAQLAKGGHQLSSSYNGQTFPAVGLTADAILALDSTGTAASEAAASRTAFDAAVKGYVSFGSDLYAGAHAKALITVLAGGENPKAATGVDLVADLTSLENAQGRFADKSSYGDNSSTLTQSLAIIALKKAGHPADAKAVTNLLSTQCADGGFATNLKGGACASDNDSTSFAVQALVAAGGQSAAVAKASSYLVAQQKADGGLIGGSAAPSENSNSTGLAAVAFAVSGHPTNAAKARSFVASLQYGCSFPAAVRGGIAYDAASYATMKKAGAGATVSDTDTRASAQAVLAFTQKPYVSIVSGGTAATPTVDCTTTPTHTTPAPTTPAPKPTTPSHSATPTHTTPAPTHPSSTSKPTTAPVPATSGTSAPVTSSPATSPATTAGHPSSSPVVGPVVNTDHEGDSSTLPFGLALAALALSGGAVAFARRH